MLNRYSHNNHVVDSTVERYYIHGLISICG